MNPEENQPTPTEPIAPNSTDNLNTDVDLTAPEATSGPTVASAESSVIPTEPISAPVEPVSAPVVEPSTTPAEPATTPAEPSTEAPSLDQVAADIAASPLAENSMLEQPLASETPSTVAEGPSVPELSPVSDATTETSSTPVAPTNDTAAEPAPSAEQPLAAPEQSESTPLSSANFVGDAPEPPKSTDISSDEEEQLQPANPVPGSIGSALVYSETAPNHAMPMSELRKQHKRISMGLSKNNIRTMLIIVAAVALVAALVVVLIFIFGGSGSKKNNTSTSTNTKPVVTNPVVSSLTCTKEGVGELFSGYGETTYGEENIIAMYTDDELTSIGSNAKFEYSNVESANAGLNIARENYTTRLESLGILSDPFTSSYDVNGTSLTVTHQAEADDIDTKSGKIFELMTVRGEVVTDAETLQDTYEENGYQCVVK